MNFDVELLSEYKQLLQTTRLREAYREFIKLFRYIRVSLEKSMPEYKFQGNISENGMDYSYFLFTNDHLKEKGLKIAVVLSTVIFNLKSGSQDITGNGSTSIMTC